MLPQEAKLRNFTYASTMTLDINIQYVVRNTENMDNPKIIEKTLSKINIGKIPIMLKSSICVLTQNKQLNNDHLYEVLDLFSRLKVIFDFEKNYLKLMIKFN